MKKKVSGSTPHASSFRAGFSVTTRLSVQPEVAERAVLHRQAAAQPPVGVMHRAYALPTRSIAACSHNANSKAGSVTERPGMVPQVARGARNFARSSDSGFGIGRSVRPSV